MVFRRFARAVAVLAGLALASAGTGPAFNVRDYGARADGATDDSAAINRAIEAAVKAGPGATVLVPAGRYRLGSEPEKGGRGPYLRIDGADGLLLQGEPSTVLVSADTRVTVLKLSGCRATKVRTLKMDADPLPFTQGLVESVDVRGRTADVRIDPGYGEPDRDYLLSGMRAFLVFTDPASGSWVREKWPPGIASRERIGEWRWRFTLTGEPDPSYAGKPWLMWENKGGWGVDVAGCRDCAVEEVTFSNGGGAGFTLWKNEGETVVRKCVIGIPPGSGRLIAASGGSMAFHNRGTVTFDGCDFSRIDDDGFNMGTGFVRILERIDDRTCRIEGSNVEFRAGDAVAVWDWQARRQRGEAKVVRAERGKDGVRLALDRAVEIARAGPGAGNQDRGRAEKDGIDRICNFDDAGKAVVRNCRISSLRARGVLIKAPDSLIEGNTFYDTHSPAILAGPEFYWGEAPPVRNLTIRNNRFVNVDVSNIYVGVFDSDASTDNRNIVIEGNNFEGYGRQAVMHNQGRRGNAVLVRNADGVTIRGNTFGPPAPGAPPGARRLAVEVSRNVTVRGNTGAPNEEIKDAPK